MSTVPKLKVRRPLAGSRQLVVNMTLLRDAYEAPAKKQDQEADEKATRSFAKRFGLSPRRIKQFKSDHWVEVSRHELQTLMVLERELEDRSQGLQYPFLSLVPHPFWETFGSDLANAYPAADRVAGAVQIDQAVVLALSEAGLKQAPNFQVVPPSELAIAMQTQNCIFVGAPIHNKNTESALQLLYPEGAPFKFQREDWDRESAHGVNGPKGIVYQTSSKWETRLDYSHQTHGKTNKPSSPAGALVVCRRPLKTQQPVTTIIVAGCSQVGTWQIAQDLLNGIVFAPPHSLLDDRPSHFILLPKASADAKEAMGGGTVWYYPGQE